MAEDNNTSSIFTSISNFFTSLKPAVQEETQASLPAGFEFSEDAIKHEYNLIVQNETGWDRVKELFKYDETIGGRVPMFEENYDLILTNGIMGFMLGSVIQTQQNNSKFKNDHQLAIYVNKKAAARAHVDFVFMQMVKGGFKLGVRFAGFTGMMVGGALISQAYWHKSSPLDYSIGSAISGGMLCLDMGFSRFLVASGVGGIFGVIFGLARHGQLTYGNKTYEDVRYEFYKKKIVQRKILLSQLSDNKDKSKESS